MSIKLALLKSGETIISDVKEVISEDKPCAYVFENAHKVLTERTIFLTEDNETDTDAKIEVSLTPWIILTTDKNILVALDWVVTLVEPIESVKQMYEEKVNGSSNKVSFTED
tara:strand:- start:6150 stop:6485 length:336 start_codon:yes stop_codon:yes gene_type:complete